MTTRHLARYCPEAWRLYDIACADGGDEAWNIFRQHVKACEECEE